jgi:4-hydroxy-2-oxoheptanedioate aldolase
MLRNAIKRAAAEGRTAFGMYVTQPAPSLVEVAGQAGLDFVRIDTYHGTMDSQTVDSLVRAAYAAGITPTARVQNDPVAILSVLEQGCMGITAPDIEDAATARAVVMAARYPPRGTREISRPQRMMAMRADEYFRWADEELIVSCQIESRRGVENIDEILAVEGVDMIQSGRNDLSLSYGVPGQPNHPIVVAAEDRIIDAALAAGKLVSISFQPGPEALERLAMLARKGVQSITIGYEAQILFQAIRDRLAAIKS